MHKLSDLAMPNYVYTHTNLCKHYVHTVRMYVQTNLKSTHFSNLSAFYL